MVDISGRLAYDSSDDEEIQDEVVSDLSDTESAPQKESESGFPRLELGSDDEDENDKYFTSNNTAVSSKAVKVGTFAGMGLSKGLLVNIQKKGFKIPTPIQRKTVPLVLEGRDVVGMARTGSGKTAAFVLPMLERLRVHSAKVGARALILSPSRELALQTLKVVKDFSRGSDLRSVLLVGGDSLEDQFGYMMNNPDIIIATPGRFLHLKVEMQLNLSSIEYVVFDEADRLFEMGFSKELDEILAALSCPDRQTLLFSATLPKSLVEFAKAGLSDPVLVRLDAESNISEQLEMAFLSIKQDQTDAAVCFVLEHIIKMPPATKEQLEYAEAESKRFDKSDADEEEEEEEEEGSRKRNRKGLKNKKQKLVEKTSPAEQSTILFVPTKYHVEFMAALLTDMGYAVSYIYGSLDQMARKEQLYRFRTGRSSILVVTDVAARGIDIPVLANVINYSLPPNPKAFIHRVGRTARAGKSGWAFSLVKESELPYLLDLELLLAKKVLLSSAANTKDPSYTDHLIIGGIPSEKMETCMSDLDALLARNYDVSLLKTVAKRGEQQYNRTRENPSSESVRRSKDLLRKGWDSLHLLFKNNEEDSTNDTELAKEALLAKFSNRKHKETVFEYRKATFGSAAELMAKRRRQIAPIQQRLAERQAVEERERQAGLYKSIDEEVLGQSNAGSGNGSGNVEMADEMELQTAFEDGDAVVTKKAKRSFRDSQYMSHYAPAELAREKGYSLTGGTGNGNFAEASRVASFDINGEGKDNITKQGMRWDKKKGKFVNAGNSNSATGKDVKYIRGEGGRRIPASFRSGRFDSWAAAHKVDGLKVGAPETPSGPGASNDFRKYQFRGTKAPKPADKARDDYHVRKKRVTEAVAKGMHVKGWSNGKKAGGLADADAIRKKRQQIQKRKEKNARPKRK